MENSVAKKVTSIIKKFLSNNVEYQSSLRSAFSIVLASSLIKYDFNSNDITMDTCVKSLSKINEKSIKQKELGAFYTSSDVCDFIVLNTIHHSVFDDDKIINQPEQLINEIKNKKNDQVDSILFEKSFIDPTCGDSEFLLSVLNIKVNLLKAVRPTDDKEIIKIAKTLYGNDLVEESTDISKVRLIIACFNHLKNKAEIITIAKSLNENFYNYDFVGEYIKINRQFDYIVGNPPYVEYSKFADKSALKNYGNIYADIVDNSFFLANPNTTLGFIVPISYTSTGRICPLRKIIEKRTQKEIVMSFADRPDCLFPSVHQKLNVIILKSGTSTNRKTYTSSYYHWGKNERKKLFERVHIIENSHLVANTLPKIGNEIEMSIFQKITCDNTHFSISQNTNGRELFLNMRACFWMKCFSFNPGSSEYKKFILPTNDYAYYYCLFNSSLYWMYWSIISDEWHITKKELDTIRIIDVDEELESKLQHLSSRLETKLEQTKKYIGTMQTEYEYKHKECKDIIDEIDSILGKLYGLTQKEIEYVKNYELQYRVGGII